jgi:uncharacterized protein Yka (UPF0111/DUF47 family)
VRTPVPSWQWARLREEDHVPLMLTLWTSYYRSFEEQAGNIVAAAELLRSLVTHYDNVSGTVRKIREIEHRGDALTAAILTRLERSRLTAPDALRTLARALDDVLDVIDATAEAFDLYGIEQPTAAATEMIELAARCAHHLASAVAVLGQMTSRTARLEALRGPREEINRLENLSDQLYREAMGALFRQENVALMLKWKQVYDSLEQITDRCDDVGDALQTAVLRRA